MKNIVLIGMPGAGKSTIGVLLAKAMNKEFVDTDILIQKEYNSFLQDIIDINGLVKFFEFENKIIKSLNIKNHVIATGGSVIYVEDSIKFLKNNGVIVYLKLRFNEIEKRIKNITSRGIAKMREQKLIDVYNEREPLYEKNADITIDCSDKDIESIIMIIIESL